MRHRVELNDLFAASDFVVERKRRGAAGLDRGDARDAFLDYSAFICCGD
jgi:hypothetical protein